jgi:hypothetical protein
MKTIEIEKFLPKDFGPRLSLLKANISMSCDKGSVCYSMELIRIQGRPIQTIFESRNIFGFGLYAGNALCLN